MIILEEKLIGARETYEALLRLPSNRIALKFEKVVLRDDRGSDVRIKARNGRIETEGNNNGKSVVDREEIGRR
jgi:hypothetical protein